MGRERFEPKWVQVPPHEHAKCAEKLPIAQYLVQLNRQQVKGFGNVTSFTLYSLLCLILNREVAENIRSLDKAVYRAHACSEIG